MTNSAAIGYMILAAKRCGLSKDAIRKLERTMYLELDFTTEDEAEEVYNNS